MSGRFEYDAFARAVNSLVYKLDADEAGPKPTPETRGEFWSYKNGWPCELARVRSMLADLEKVMEIHVEKVS